MPEMSLEQAQCIALAYRDGGYATPQEQKIIDYAKHLVWEHAQALLGELKDDQDAGC